MLDIQIASYSKLRNGLRSSLVNGSPHKASLGSTGQLRSLSLFVGRLVVSFSESLVRHQSDAREVVGEVTDRRRGGK